MKTNVGALLFGAAVLSLFVPKRRLVESRKTLAATVKPQSPPDKLYALVQTRPTVAVLAISASVEELEREVAELNETWNHWALRLERHRFEIHPAPVLAIESGTTHEREREFVRRA